MLSTLALTLLIAGSLCLGTFVATRAWNHPPARLFALFVLGYALTDLGSLVHLQANSPQLVWLMLVFLVVGLLLVQIGLLLLFAALFVPEWWRGRRPIRWIVLPYLIAGACVLLDLVGRLGLFVTAGLDGNGYSISRTISPGGPIMLILMAGGWLVHMGVLVAAALRQREFRPLIGLLAAAIGVSTFTGYLLGTMMPSARLNALALLPVLAVLAYAVFRTGLFTSNEAGIEQALRAMGEAVAIWDQAGRITYANTRAADLGLQPGQSLAAALAAAGLPDTTVASLSANGAAPAVLALNSRRIAVTLTSVRDRRGHSRGTLLLGRDITDLETRTAELDAERAQLAATVRQLEAEQAERAALTATVRALSLPVIPVLEGVLVLPLVGDFDTARAVELSGVLLQAIERERARLVLIDITGVPLLDTAGAAALLQATRAAGLLGARCMLVGIRPEIAQSLVALGVPLDTLDTAATLQQGLRHVLAAR